MPPPAPRHGPGWRGWCGRARQLGGGGLRGPARAGAVGAHRARRGRADAAARGLLRGTAPHQPSCLQPVSSTQLRSWASLDCITSPSLGISFTRALCSSRLHAGHVEVNISLNSLASQRIVLLLVLRSATRSWSQVRTTGVQQGPRDRSVHPPSCSPRPASRATLWRCCSYSGPPQLFIVRRMGSGLLGCPA